MREIPRVAESAGSTTVMCRRFVFGCVAMWCLACLPSRLGAQVGTFGAGALITEANVKPVAEVYLGAPLMRGFRAYGISSWTNDTWSPTFITAVEREVLSTDHSFTTLGAGLLWPEFQDYDPDPILTSTTVVPLPFAPALSLVVVGSTQPFTDFDWTIVAKLAVTLFFRG